MGDGNGYDDHRTDDNVHEVTGNADQVEAVFHHANQEHAHQCADHAAFAAVETGTAEHRRRQHIQLATDQRIRYHFTDAIHLHQPANRRHRAEISVGKQMQQPHADTDTSRGLLITSDGKQLASEMGFVEQDPAQSGDRQHDHHWQTNLVMLLADAERQHANRRRQPVRQVV
ncbi:hypothetical protein D3C73_932790 [compost metagenome]